MNYKNSSTGLVVSVLLTSLLLVACGEKPEVMLATAKTYLAKNDAQAAVIQLKSVLQESPDLPEARFLLGSALLNSGDPVGAETELRKALDLKYNNDDLLPLMAKALLAQGESKKLIDEFATASLVNPQSIADFQSSLAVAYAVVNKPELSQKALQAALKAQPDYSAALLIQARDKASKKDFDGALELIDAILAKEPKNQDGYKLKGDIYLIGKAQATEALAAYRKSIEVKPDFIPGYVGVITLLLQQGNLTEAATQVEALKKQAKNLPQTKYFEAQLAFQKKDFKAARDLVLEVLKVAPENVQSLQLAGAVEFQLNSPVQAEDYLSRAIAAAPDLTLARRLLVTLYLRTGQTSKAIATMQPGLSRDNVDPELISVAGEAYMQTGDFKKAEEYFAQATKASPKDGRKRTSLAVAHLLNGQTDSAFSELQQIAATDTGVTADMALISAHLRRQEYDKALAAIDGLEKKTPDKPLAANLRGRTLLVKQDQAGARKSFERALAIDPTFFPAVASLAAMDVVGKKPEEAKKRFEAVLAKNPKEPQALIALAELAARTGGTKEEVTKLLNNAVTANPGEFSPRLLLVDYLLRNKDLTQALSVAQDAAAAFPNNPDVLDALGRTQIDAGRATNEYNQAIATYQKMADLQPRSAAPLMRLADIYALAKNTESSRNALTKALAIQPDLVAVQRALISYDLQDKKVDHALGIAKTVQKQRPTEAVGYLLEGDIQATQKNWDSAISAYRAGLKQSSNAELAIKLHSTLVASGNLAQANVFAASRLHDAPKDTGFLLYLGDAAAAQKNLVEAEKQYTKVTQIQPNNAVAFNNLAWVVGQLKKPGGLALVDKALALAPDQAAFMDTKAGLLADKADFAQAVELQKKAMSLEPENQVFKMNLARIYVRSGQKDLAKGVLTELSKLGDKFAGQTEVAKLLQTL